MVDRRDRTAAFLTPHVEHARRPIRFLRDGSARSSDRYLIDGWKNHVRKFCQAKVGPCWLDSHFLSICNRRVLSKHHYGWAVRQIGPVVDGLDQQQPELQWARGKHSKGFPNEHRIAVGLLGCTTEVRRFWSCVVTSRPREFQFSISIGDGLSTVSESTRKRRLRQLNIHRSLQASRMLPVFQLFC